jgi:hypothetical protein
MFIPRHRDRQIQHATRPFVTCRRKGMRISVEQAGTILANVLVLALSSRNWSEIFYSSSAEGASVTSLQQWFAPMDRRG